MIPRLALPPRPAVLALLALAFALPGLIGHDPWKSLDAIAIEVAHQMQVTGDWVVPRVAGTPELENPPLFHWLALGFGKLLGGLVPFHNGARVASGLCVLLALWLLARTAGAAAALLLIGAMGFMVHAHEALPELAGLAVACAAYAVLPRAHDRPLLYGAAFGGALGLMFLADGPFEPAALALTAIVAHAACPRLRGWRALPFLGVAAAVCAPLCASWLWVLAARAPELPGAWWALATQTWGKPLDNLRYFLVTASWFTWPAWPLAAWALWARRRDWREPELFVPAASCVILLAGLSWTGPAQDVALLAVLPPIVLLGAQGVQHLRRGAAAALDWFAVMCFTFFAGLVWLAYLAFMTGAPARLAQLLARPAPGFEASFSPASFLLALLLTLGWLYVAFFTAPSPVRGVTRWAAGVTLLWSTFALLLMPWADHQKSYRAVALQLRSKIAPDAGCVAGHLGITQRASMSYFAELQTEPVSRAGPDGCRLLLLQGSPGDDSAGPGPGWTKLADVGRPGDKAERYRLYQLERK
jgi:4-amino-4-deoxy-L-arabinose transferase-like glycosyltransferase